MLSNIQKLMLHSELDMHAVTPAFRFGFNVSLQITQVQRLHVPAHVKTPVDTYVLLSVCKLKLIRSTVQVSIRAMHLSIHTYCNNVNLVMYLTPEQQ